MTTAAPTAAPTTDGPVAPRRLPSSSKADSYDKSDLQPLNPFVMPMLTDLYNITMCYGHWLHGRADTTATFELYFRKNPFGGEYTVFAGLEECVKFMANFRFATEHIQYLRQQPMLSGCKEGFWQWLTDIDCSRVRVTALREGTFCFPRIPLLLVEGPLAITQAQRAAERAARLLQPTPTHPRHRHHLDHRHTHVYSSAARAARALPKPPPPYTSRLSGQTAARASAALPSALASPSPRLSSPRLASPPPALPLASQLLETTLLNCINYASLLATNAARFRAAVGPEIKLFEFGLRRAQGPDGGISASRYSFLGGFDGTTNALAGHMCEVPLHGTMAHAFIQSFSDRSDLSTNDLFGPPPSKTVRRHPPTTTSVAALRLT